MDSITRDGEKRFYVYTYAYPDGTVFYVGKGTGTRFKQHEWEARRFFPEYRSTTPVCAVIQQIWLSDQDFIRTIVCDHMIEYDAYRLEEQLIAKYDSDKLVNIASGGAGIRRKR